MTKKTKTEDDTTHVEPIDVDTPINAGRDGGAVKKIHTDPTPSIGRIVHYSLTEAQAAFADAQAGRKNTLEAGKLCPAIVTDVHNDNYVDLRVIIRGQDTFVTSAMKGSKPGMWRWPERV